MIIKEIQQNALALCEEKGFKDRSPAQRFRCLVSEIGELNTELLRLEWERDDHTEAKHNIGLEMYDIVWNFCDLANQPDTDLEQAFSEKAAHSEGRVWARGGAK